MKNKKILLVLIFVFALVVTRFYNLEKTTRFTRDESQNLVDMHRIYKNREITFVGPINYGETIVYPSTTFYMLLPFSMAGNFEPFSPALGTAFFGVLTAILVLLITKELNKKLIYFVAILLIVWFPLLETSRWAWNPHLVPFTTFLAIFLFLQKNKYLKFLSGFMFGISFHLHYLTIFSFATFGFLTLLVNLKKKDYKTPIFLGLGFFIALIPFVIFDLRNPPGLFFTHYVKDNLISSGAGGELTLFPKTFIENIFNVLLLIGQTKAIAVVLGALLSIIIYKDIRNKNKGLLYLIPVVPQLAIVSFLPIYENRYFYLGLPFFITWLIYSRKQGQNLAKIAIVLMILGSVIGLKDQLTTPIREPDTYSINEASNHVVEVTARDSLKNVNIAALASPDTDPLGIIYRHTLLVKDVDLLADHQYEITDNLFVISTSEPEMIRSDPANVMINFRHGPIVDEYQIKDSKWKVYLFNRNPN